MWLVFIRPRGCSQRRLHVRHTVIWYFSVPRKKSFTLLTHCPALPCLLCCPPTHWLLPPLPAPPYLIQGVPPPSSCPLSAPSPACLFSRVCCRLTSSRRMSCRQSHPLSASLPSCPYNRVCSRPSDPVTAPSPACPSLTTIPQGVLPPSNFLSTPPLACPSLPSHQHRLCCHPRQSYFKGRSSPLHPGSLTKCGTR